MAQSTSLFALLLTANIAVADSSPTQATSAAESPAAATAASATDFRPVVQADPAPAPFFTGAIPRTVELADDATLHDVTGIGSNCWAVGDRGILLRSQDGGHHWESAFVPVDCTLKSVCFLTDQIGFAAGRIYSRHDRRLHGILLTTRDGGQSWRQISDGDPQQLHSQQLTGTLSARQLPPIQVVRFFDLQNGVVVCGGTSEHRRGIVATTSDGGRNWKLLSDDTSGSLWTAGDFLHIGNGIVCGHSNGSGIVVGKRVLQLDAPGLHLKRWRDASLTTGGSAWLAGDNGQLLHSNDQGVTWKPAALHRSIGDVLDYHSVDQAGAHVCVAGSPGSVILLSTDAGTSWTLRQLPNSSPIHRVRFVTPQLVLAVGAFGKIFRSEDSGQSWLAVRNDTHRAAVLSLVSNPDNLPAEMLATVAADEAYRAVAVQLSGRLPDISHDDRLDMARQQQLATTLAVSHYDFDWILTRTERLQNLTPKELRTAWSRQTDGRIDELLPLRLARLLRIWRPDVITIDGDSDLDILPLTWQQLLEQAQQLAADSSGTTLLDKIGLQPWRTSGAFVRQFQQHQTPLNFPRDQVLPRIGTTVAAVVDQSASSAERWSAESGQARPTVSYRRVSADGHIATPQHLFSGLRIAPGSEARRKLHVRSDTTELRTVSRQSQLQVSAAVNHMQQSAHPESVIAELPQLGRDLPPGLQLQQLQSLAEQFAQIENLEGEIAVHRQIVTRFPQAAAAIDSAELLFLFYSSEELRGLRRADSQTAVADRSVQQVAATIPGLRNALNVAPKVSPAIPNELPNSNGRDADLVANNWDRKAEHYLQFLREVAPDRVSSASILLRQAANQRRRGEGGAERTLLSQAASEDSQTGRLAAAEMEALQNVPVPTLPVLHIPETATPPFLDGRITDECWAAAPELPMRSLQGTRDDLPCILMMCWDRQHLYLAGRLRLPSDQPPRQDQTATRKHDADHLDLDRLHIMFDFDRDYRTGFHFTIDEAGQTSESCWRERRWNPDWYVAETTDGPTWGFEAAIPHASFGTDLQAGRTWCIKAERIAPGIVSQYLSNADVSAGPSSISGFGLIRFVRHP